MDRFAAGKAALTYTGLCIGGPDDGLIKTANDEVRVGYKINRGEVYGFDHPIPPEAGLLETTVYRFERWQAPVRLHPGPDDYERYGFWLAADMTGAAAIERLRAVYAKATRMGIDDIRATMDRLCAGADGTGSVLPC